MKQRADEMVSDEMKFGPKGIRMNRMAFTQTLLNRIPALLVPARLALAGFAPVRFGPIRPGHFFGISELWGLYLKLLVVWCNFSRIYLYTY